MTKEEFEMHLILLGFVVAKKYNDGNFRYEFNDIKVWMYNEYPVLNIANGSFFNGNPFQKAINTLLKHLDKGTTINDS